MEFREADADARLPGRADMGPHDDVPGGLSKICDSIPLVILSNAMNSQIMSNVGMLGATFHKVCTAESAQAYKPRMQAFEYMFDTIGMGPEVGMHVSSSFRYDQNTATDLGFGCRVFVGRGHEPSNANYRDVEIPHIGALPAGGRPLTVEVQSLSYWQSSTPQFAGGEQGQVEGDCDVAIIGGGFTGLSAALELARSGAKVAVLEAGRIIGAASGRNGGQCNAGTAHDFGALASAHGMDLARKWYLAHVEAVETVGRIAAREGIDCDYMRCGRAKLAAKPEHFANLKLPTRCC